MADDFLIAIRFRSAIARSEWKHTGDAASNKNSWRNQRRKGEMV